MDSYKKKMQNIARRFEDVTGKGKFTASEIARWAIENDLWDAPDRVLVRICADDMSRALREEYTTDPQGRRVRTKHVVVTGAGGKQMALWGDMRRVDRKFMELSVQGRRKAVLSDCRQLKADVNSYNENFNPGKPIQLSLDFTNDVIEAEIAEAKPKKAFALERERPSGQFPVAARRSASQRALSRT